MSKRNAITLISMLKSIFRHRELLWDLVKRDFIGRYKGSMLGIIWSMFNPLLMLVIYTIVFSVAFKAKWGSGVENKVSFAIVLFSGIVVHSFFAECINRAPDLIRSQPNLVKKVIFPLEILPWMILISSFFHFLISMIILLIFCLIAGMPIHGGAIIIPIALIPLMLLNLGFAWIFASLGVFLRDLSQIMGILTTVSLFMAPIFYPAKALPQVFGKILIWNPITLPVIQLRNLLLWGKPFLWSSWAISLVISIAICQLGYWWFQKTRHGFADVL